MTPRRTSSNKATIKDVARLSGVSTQTVSRVLNDRPDVSPDTREKILEVINRLGYQPSALARSLIQRRSFTLGVIIAGLKYQGISLTLNGITEQADKDGYSLLLEELPSFNVTDVQPVVRSLMSHQVEAIIYAAPEIGENWRNVQMQCPRPCPPMVFLKGSPYPGISTISVDNYLGAYLATLHLYDQGCRNIAHISGPLEWWEATERIRGWRAALERLGIRPEEKQCIQGNWSSSSGEKVFQNLLANYPEMDGVFVANDQMALSVLHVAHEQGIPVPQKLAVVGFDDLAETPYYSPALTTVRQDLHELGIMAVKKVLQMIEPGDDPLALLPDTIIIKPQVIVRSSSLFGQTIS
jgi:DNA-binding LacI/PurR family transcriptional regulator